MLSGDRHSSTNDPQAEELEDIISFRESHMILISTRLYSLMRTPQWHSGHFPSDKKDKAPAALMGLARIQTERREQLFFVATETLADRTNRCSTS